METSTGYVSVNGARLFFERDAPSEQPERAGVLILHGGGEHGGRHRRLAHYLADNGFVVLRPDLRGAGRSTGRRWHILRYEQYLNDLEALLEKVPLPNPLFLIGQSVGGLLAITYVQNHSEQVAGLIALSPFLGMRMAVPAWKEVMAQTLSVIMPFLQLPSGLPLEKLAHDPEVAKAYRADPYCCSVVSTRWYMEIKKAQQTALSRAGELVTPLMVVQGGADDIADPAVSEQFYRSAKSPDKEWVYYPDAYHEVLNEVWHAEACQHIERFITAQLGKHSSA